MFPRTCREIKRKCVLYTVRSTQFLQYNRLALSFLSSDLFPEKAQCSNLFRSFDLLSIHSPETELRYRLDQNPTPQIKSHPSAPHPLTLIRFQDFSSICLSGEA